MLGRLLDKIQVSKHSQKWEVFINELFSQEDFLPQLHAPSILLSLKPEIYFNLPDGQVDDYTYRQKEEVVLKTVLDLLSEKITSEEYSPWSPDLIERKETLRLFGKIEQLIINKGYILHQNPALSKSTKIRQSRIIG
ncbi:MAG: hypothetical protein ACRBB6_06235 [Neptuniibacter sp.]